MVFAAFICFCPALEMRMAATAGTSMTRVSSRQMTTFRPNAYRSAGSPPPPGSASGLPSRLGDCACSVDKGDDDVIPRSAVSLQAAGTTTPLSRDSVECFSSEASTIVINPEITEAEETNITSYSTFG
jgi:hypothetical protein